VTAEWVAAAGVIALASFVLGLVGFGNGLVAMALLPFLMSPLTALAILTIYTIIFSTAIFVPVRRHFLARPVADLLVGTAVGAPVGVWILSVVPIAALNRLIGATLVAVVVLEWAGLNPRELAGRGWRLGAGMLAGVAGAAVGTPGPPVILYSATQGWSPRTIKANLQAFFVVNQVVILAGYWWIGVIDGQVWRLAASFALPAAGGTALGMLLFSRVDHRRFRQLVFAVLLVAGILLIARG
jgi:uncharacterized membrane protein YfcA